jgi:hypothetical protein
LQLVFEEVMERTREKEEKEAKKKQRLADEFTDLLYSVKVNFNLFHKKSYFSQAPNLSYFQVPYIFCSFLFYSATFYFASYQLEMWLLLVN